MAYHNKIKNFLKSRGLEVIVELDPEVLDTDSAKYSDDVGKSYSFNDLYQKLYEDILRSDLGKNLTISAFFHEVDRVVEGIYVEFSLNNTNTFKDILAFNETHYSDSYVRYEIKIVSKPYSNLDEFIKNEDFMKMNYTAFENIFSKTLNPDGKKNINEIRFEDGEEGGTIIKSYSTDINSGDKISIFTDGKGMYFLHMQLKIDNADKDKIFDAVKESRAISNKYLNK